MPSGRRRKNERSHDARCWPPPTSSTHPLATRRVPRRRHGDERARARALRADRGRRGAGRRRRAARPLVARSSASRSRSGAASSASPASRRRWSTPRRRPRRCCPSSRGCCAAACWSRTRRASTSACCAQAFARAALDWPDPPVLCTVALARRLRAAAAPPRAGRAGRRARRSRSRATHRALPDARDVRARVLRAVRAPVRARGDGRRRGRAARRRGAARGRGAAPRRRAPPRAGERPDLSALPQGPGRLHLPRRRRPPALRRQVGLPAHARARALHDAGATWTGAGRARRLPGDASPSSARCCSRTG